MKTNLRFAALAAGALALTGVARAEVLTIPSPVGTFTTSTTRPFTTYSYSNPHLSVYSGVQFGNNQNTTVTQHSDRNIASVAQVGNNTRTTVTQSGFTNYSAVSQFGKNHGALVIQFGH
jgi:hypothetical protein